LLSQKTQFHDYQVWIRSYSVNHHLLPSKFGPTPFFLTCCFLVLAYLPGECALNFTVLRWLASKMDSSRAKEVLRGLTNCKVNKVCPLVFPDMKHVTKECSNTMRNQTECRQAMESYVSHLQKQSLITKFKYQRLL
ncbi:unnamed protein product, partial [Linum tenue]